MKSIPAFLLLLCLCSCMRGKDPKEETLVSIQVVDRNGFSETISTKDRLARYKNINFLESQPYQKVLCVYGKTPEGKSPSKITSYHSNGHVWQFLEVLDGRAHGHFVEWHSNGQKKLDLQVIEGPADLSEVAQNSWVFEGKNSVWDEDGHLLAEIYYEHGMLHGTSLYYFPNGQIKRKLSYFRGLLQEEELCYDETGSLLEVIPYADGLRHGTAKGFWNPESIMYEEIYEKDLLQKGSYFSKEGTLISSIEGGYGKRALFENGILSSLIEYRKAIPEGKVELLNEQGLIKAIYEQKEGKKHGEEWLYYPQKNPSDPLRPKICLTWQEDQLQGPVKTWYPEGGQESQKEIYQNKKNGIAFAWYKNGDIMLMEEYEHELLISGTYYKKGDKQPVSKIEKGKGTATLYDPDGYFLRKISYDKGDPLLEDSH